MAKFLFSLLFSNCVLANLLMGRETQYAGIPSRQFVKFELDTQLQYQLCLVGSSEELTLIFWFSLSSLTDQSANLVDFEPGFKCSITSGRLKCADLSITFDFEMDTWYPVAYQS